MSFHDDKPCKVRQVSVLFPGMDEAKARAVAEEGLDKISHLSMVVFLKIDDTKQNHLEEKNQGIRMFFHASESRKIKWWKNKISRLSNDGEQFFARRKDDKQAAAHRKLWEDDKYSHYAREFETFSKPKLTTNNVGDPEVNGCMWCFLDTDRSASLRLFDSMHYFVIS